MDASPAPISPTTSSIASLDDKEALVNFLEINKRVVFEEWLHRIESISSRVSILNEPAILEGLLKSHLDLLKVVANGRKTDILRRYDIAPEKDRDTLVYFGQITAFCDNGVNVEDVIVCVKQLRMVMMDAVRSSSLKFDVEMSLVMFIHCFFEYTEIVALSAYWKKACEKKPKDDA
eukprot:TRINITY_DN405_c0_g1_i1.p1 TRINITY_DN405_c0_g1~~TRINITY_DN405_c0_g1_i1.p1  ORF type:complete len:176 (+),score=32.46 TRINITY_DN405_c0_g1_i1:198-725(+)